MAKQSVVHDAADYPSVGLVCRTLDEGPWFVVRGWEYGAGVGRPKTSVGYLAGNIEVCFDPELWKRAVA